MGKEIIIIFVSMPSACSMKGGTIGNNNRTTGGKPGLLGMVESSGREIRNNVSREKKDEAVAKHLEIMLQRNG